MRQLKWRRAASVLVLLILAAAGADAPATPIPGHPPGADRLPPDAARMYGLVTTPHPGELKWQQIPWLTDLREGIRQARAEGRAMVLFVSGDDPLEKC
jgi:hypothetical protein